MNVQDIKDLISQKIAGQGSMVDIGGGLPQILNGILDLLADVPSQADIDAVNNGKVFIFTPADTDHDPIIASWLETFNENNDTEFASLYELASYLAENRNVWAIISTISGTKMRLINAHYAFDNSGVLTATFLFGVDIDAPGNGRVSVYIYTAENPAPDGQFLQVVSNDV